MKQKILFFTILLAIILTTSFSSGHNLHEIELQEVDVSPQLKQSRGGPVQINIDKDSTSIYLGTITDFTIRHALFGSINFTGYNLEYDGMEAYKLILHQDIYLDEIVDIPFKLGTRSQTLSESALRDGLIYYSYILGDMNDVDGFLSDQLEDINELSDNAKSQYQYSIHSSLEIIRGTKQNATLYFDYELSSYEIPNIPTENFHRELTLKTSIFPNKIDVQESISLNDNHKIFLFLPVRLLPFYFQSPQGHEMNLTELPISIYLNLTFARDDNDKQVRISGNGDNAMDTKNPILDNDRDKSYRLPTEIKDSQLIPLTISILKYGGPVKIEVEVTIKAIFTDTSLYAKNTYPFSPNQYILIMTFTGTVFIYKVVDYVDYRKFQQTLGYKKYDLVEKDFIG